MWPREWALLGGAFVLLVAFTLLVDAHNEWELVIGIDRLASSWLQSVVCDRASGGGDP